MRNEPLASNARVLVFALASVLLLMTLVTAQVALAGPPTGVGGQTGTVPTETPIPTPPPAPPAIPATTPTPTTPLPPVMTPEPAVALPVTAAYDWLTETVIEIPVFELEPQSKVAFKVPARSMFIGGEPASGQITVTPLDASSVAEVSVDTLPDRPRLTFAGRAVEISVFGHTATSSPAYITDQVRFDPPLEVGFDITQEEWDLGVGDITAFEVRYFSVQENRWVAISGTVDPYPLRRVTGTVRHLTSFGLFVEPPPPPPVPDGGDYSLGMGGAGLAALFGVTLIILGFYMRRRGISGA